MKKFIYTSLLSFCLFTFAFAQNLQTRLDYNKSVKTEKKIAKSGFEALMPAQQSVPAANRSMFDVILGTTYYDLQTNNSIAPRLTLRSDNTMATTWTMSAETAAFSDRGAGYTTRDVNGNWDPAPTERIQSERTGFNNYLESAGGREHIICHTVGAEVMHLTKMPSEATWEESKLPLMTPSGVWWARAAASGSTLHVIYLTMPTGNGGTVVDGMDGKVLYARSTDAGTTWDIVDAELPGVDSTRYAGISAEEYAIDAFGDDVAIGIFPLLGDKLLIKSTDNGSTWAMRRVQNFPIDKYDLGAYSFADVAFQYDSTTYPDSLAMFTGDGSGALIIDPSGKTHYFFSPVFILDTDFSDEGYNYFPNQNLGIVYWNEDMDDDAFEFTDLGAPDLNGDTIWGLTGYENYIDYGYAFCTQPSVGLDPLGNLHVAFLAPHELDVNDANASYFRKPYHSYRPLGGGTWKTPQPIVNEFNSDFTLAPFQEILFPQIPRAVAADSVCFIAQVDYTQGINVFDNTQDNCSIQFYCIGNDAPVSATSVDAVSTFTIAPNPARKHAVLLLDLEKSLDAHIRIVGQTGQVIRTMAAQKFTAGTHQVRLDIASLDSGLYFVQLLSDSGIETAKLVVLR